ncbi:MAG: hypothetical protein HOV79_20325 [Hamadaea sp.]|nr:hypothetical protein [Hamadaea sp.]
MEHGQTFHDHDAWESAALDALGRVQKRQAQMIENYDLRGDVQYHWSVDDGVIVWSRGGTAFLRGRLTLVATVNTVHQTWLWSWANDSLPDAVLGDVARVRQHGEDHAYPLLTWRSFRADQKPVAQARMVAADVLDAEGLWFDRVDDLEFHFVLHDLRRVGPGE